MTMNRVLNQKVVRQRPTVQVDNVGPGSGKRRAEAGWNLPKTPKCPQETLCPLRRAKQHGKQEAGE